MAEYLSPGVYVEEYDNPPRTMEGVATSVAGFVGLAERGTAAGAPVLILTYPEFTRKFGGYLNEAAFGEYRYLAGAVEQFFQNGGSRCYVARVLPSDARSASFDNGQLSVTAGNEGSWGNRVELHFVEDTKKGLTIRVMYDDEVEEFEELNLHPESANYIGRRLQDSRLVKLQYKGPNEGEDIPLPGNPVAALLGEGNRSIRLEGGADGTKENITASTFIGVDEGPEKRTGIQAFLENNTVSIIAAPGVTIPEVINSLG